MKEEKLTSRQIQAEATKNKIYQVSIKLMEESGYNNVKIGDICKKAEVSVGSFYNYFNSKNDILIEVFKRIDDSFKYGFEKKLTENNTAQDIVLFFSYYAKYIKSLGVDTAKCLYSADVKMFLIHGRYIQVLLQKILIKCQEKGEISNEFDLNELNRDLFIAARGVIFDWCVNDGKYDVSKFMEEYFRKLVKMLRN